MEDVESAYKTDHERGDPHFSSNRDYVQRSDEQLSDKPRRCLVAVSRIERETRGL